MEKEPTTAEKVETIANGLKNKYTADMIADVLRWMIARHSK